MFWRHDIGKKNGWPIGHPDTGQLSTILDTLIVPCQCLGKDSMAYLKDILTRVPLLTNRDDVHALTPRAWKLGVSLTS